MARRPARADWLHCFPPLRTPRFRRARLGHDMDRALFVGFFVGMGRLFVWMIAAGLWAAEIEAWLLVWFYYGMFLGARQVYRSNLIGRAVGMFARGRRKPAAGIDPYATPVDLAHQDADEWDGPVRHRR